MKKIFVLLAVSLFSVSVFAQTEKGAIRLGGSTNLSFISSKLDGASKSNSNFNLGANAGYFVMDNLSVDVGFEFDYDKPGGASDAFTQFVVDLGVRYYLPSKIFFAASFDLLSMKVVDSVTGTGVSLGAGYAWFLSDKVAFEPMLGYRLGLSDKDKGTKVNAFGAQMGISVFF